MKIWADTGKIWYKGPMTLGAYDDLPRKPYRSHEGTTPGGGDQVAPSPHATEGAPLSSYRPLIALAISSSLAAYSIGRARRLTQRPGRRRLGR